MKKLTRNPIGCRRSISVFALSFLLVQAVALQAATVVDELFTYADTTSIAGLNGGTGWTGGWGAAVLETGNTNGTGHFEITGNTAVFKGDGVNQNIMTHARSLSSSVTVSTLDTVTVSFDLTLASGDNQAGRGIGMNFLSGTNIQFVIGKRINDDVGLYDGSAPGGIGTPAVQLGGADFGKLVGTYSLTAALNYDGSDTAVSLTDGSTTINHTFVGTQISFDNIQLAGYHKLTVNNTIDNFVIDVALVPEPTSASLLLLGAVFGVGALRRRRQH